MGKKFHNRGLIMESRNYCWQGNLSEAFSWKSSFSRRNRNQFQFFSSHTTQNFTWFGFSLWQKTHSSFPIRLVMTTKCINEVRMLCLYCHTNRILIPNGEKGKRWNRRNVGVDGNFLRHYVTINLINGWDGEYYVDNVWKLRTHSVKK